MTSRFVQGATVYHVHYPRWGGEPASYRKDAVLKVHKTGNFTLVSDPSAQYSPDYDGVTARRTGKTRYYTDRVHLLTDELVEQMKNNRAERRRIAMARAITAVEVRKDDSDLETLATIYALRSVGFGLLSLGQAVQS